MFSSAWNFIKRHKKKFIFTGALIGGTFVAVKYFQHRLSDLQEKEAEECLVLARRQHHFDSNQRTCNKTLLSLLPSLRVRIQEELDSDALTKRLKSNPDDRLVLWDQLKVVSCAQCVCAVYSFTMTALLLRVQLNVIGGYLYVDSERIRNSASSDVATISQKIQQSYLELVNHILGEGLVVLAKDVKYAVESATEDITIKQALNIHEIKLLIHRIRQQVEFGQVDPEAWSSATCQYMLPSESLEACQMTPDEVVLSKLMMETRDVIKSADFRFVLSTALDTTFVRLMDEIAEFFRPKPAQDLLDRPNSSESTMHMAKIIPVMSSLVHSVCRETQNAYLQDLLVSDQIKQISANIYEAFSQELS